MSKQAQGIRLTKARTRNEARAAWTIGLTVAVYALCYMPCILYSRFVGDSQDMAGTTEAKWLGFAANYFLFVSSGCNPFIYLVRTTRFRVAIKQLLKDPFGSEDIKMKKAV